MGLKLRVEVFFKILALVLEVKVGVYFLLRFKHEIYFIFFLIFDIFIERGEHPDLVLFYRDFLLKSI